MSLCVRRRGCGDSLGNGREYTSFYSWFRALCSMPILIIDTDTVPTAKLVYQSENMRQSYVPVVDVKAINRHLDYNGLEFVARLHQSAQKDIWTQR